MTNLTVVGAHRLRGMCELRFMKRLDPGPLFLGFIFVSAWLCVISKPLFIALAFFMYLW